MAVSFSISAINIRTATYFLRRLVSSTEPFFHFAKSDNYFYNPKAFLAKSHAPQSPKKKMGPMLDKNILNLLMNPSFPTQKKPSHGQN